MRRLMIGFFALALAAPAWAQTPFADAPSKRVSSGDPGKIERNPGGEEDCEIAGDPHHARLKLTQELKPEATRIHEVALRGGQRYRLIMMCDDNCSAMSLDLVEAATGRSLGKVDPGISAPTVEFDLPDTGTIRATVRMVACKDAEGCKYGVGVFTLPPEFKPTK
jgi:hypothetical protein